ncbi:hypothetical protein [Halopiger goleimassiliensis]|nr:hypothetical protein [Halopiger goleimassiliensis]
MQARCPNCDDGLGELVDKRVSSGEPVAEFVCRNCDYEWSIQL